MFSSFFSDIINKTIATIGIFTLLPLFYLLGIFIFDFFKEIKKLKNFKDNLRIFLKIFSIFFIAIFLTNYLYPLKEEIIFNGKKYQQFDLKNEDLFSKKPGIKNLIAESLSLELKLDWYRIKIEHNGVDPDCPKTPVFILFSFFKGDPREYKTDLKEGEKIISENGGSFESKYPNYYLKTGDKKFFVVPSWKEYSINGGVAIYEDCKKEDFGFHESIYDYNISRVPYWPYWFVKLFIIFFFEITFLSSCVTIKNQLLRNKK